MATSRARCPELALGRRKRPTIRRCASRETTSLRSWPLPTMPRPSTRRCFGTVPDARLSRRRNQAYSALRVPPQRRGDARAPGIDRGECDVAARADCVWRPCGRDVHGSRASRAPALVTPTARSPSCSAPTMLVAGRGIAAIYFLLAVLCNHSRFRALVDRARTDVAAQRERERQRGLLDFAPLLGRALE